MRIDIVTIFPGIVSGGLGESIPARAVERGLVDVQVHDLRAYTTDKHRTVDDAPYGGGPGMVMKPEPFFRAVAALRQPGITSQVILLDPQGKVFDQRHAQRLAAADHLILLCGRYEGVDERVRLGLAAEQISIGDYILSGGEIAALVVTDAVIRLLPGALGHEESAADESFSDGLLEGPQYTRPREFAGMSVPPVLLSGDHQAIARWRRQQALQRTLAQRPDLLAKAALSQEDFQLLHETRPPRQDEQR